MRERGACGAPPVAARPAAAYAAVTSDRRGSATAARRRAVRQRRSSSGPGAEQRPQLQPHGVHHSKYSAGPLLRRRQRRTTAAETLHEADAAAAVVGAIVGRLKRQIGAGELDKRGQARQGRQCGRAFQRQGDGRGQLQRGEEASHPQLTGLNNRICRRVDRRKQAVRCSELGPGRGWRM